MLVHICCSVDSHYFLSELKKIYAGEIVGYFYDPNIHPQSEYELRFLDVKRSCDKLKIKLIKGEYELDNWFDFVKGLENEPERGKRCQKCFDFRMKKSVEMAVKLGFSRLTTTLLTSPKKDLKQLKFAMQKECEPYNIEFFAPDFRVNGGTQRQFSLAKCEQLYHQNYCGCIYALKQQRAVAYELLSDIFGRVLPGSIEEKISIYQKVTSLEKNGMKFRIRRLKFLNYRLLFGKILCNKKPIKSHILFYSHFKSKRSSFSVNDGDMGFGDDLHIFYSHKDEIVLMEFSKINDFLGGMFDNFDMFLKNPPKIDDEKAFRKEFLGDFSLSPIIIVEKIQPGKWEIIAQSDIFYDTCERLDCLLV